MPRSSRLAGSTSLFTSKLITLEGLLFARCVGVKHSLPDDWRDDTVYGHATFILEYLDCNFSIFPIHTIHRIGLVAEIGESLLDEADATA